MHLGCRGDLLTMLPGHYPQTPSVLERCLNGYYRLQFRLALVRAFGDVNQARTDFGLAPVHDKGDLLAHQLVLANSAFGLEASRPMAPHFTMVGLLRSRSLLEASRSSSTIEAGVSGRHSLPPALVSWLRQGNHLMDGRATTSRSSDLVYISFPPDVPLSPEFVVQLVRSPSCYAGSSLSICVADWHLGCGGAAGCA